MWRRKRWCLITLSIVFFSNKSRKILFCVHIKSKFIAQSILLSVKSFFFILFCIIACQSAPDAKQPVVSPKKETKNNPLVATPDTGLIIYLTFDDGPYKTTPNIVKVLEKENIKASFFIVGSQRDRSTAFDSTYRRNLMNPMIRFYNHSYSHAISGGRIKHYYKNPEAVLADLEKNRAYIPAASKIIRLPGKTIWRTKIRNRTDKMTAGLIKLMDEKGLSDRIMGWDFSWKNDMSKEVSQVDTLINNIIKIGRAHV